MVVGVVLALGAWAALSGRHRQWGEQLHIVVQVDIAEKRGARHFEAGQPQILPLPVFTCIQTVHQLFHLNPGLLGRIQDVFALEIVGESGVVGCVRMRDDDSLRCSHLELLGRVELLVVFVCGTLIRLPGNHPLWGHHIRSPQQRPQPQT